MPWWASLYFTAFSLVVLWSAVSELKDGRQTSVVVADLIGESALIVVALAYWIGPLANALSEILIPLYAFAIVAFLVAMYLDVREYLFSDPELSTKENVWTTVVGTGLATVLSLPALIWGGLAAGI